MKKIKSIYILILCSLLIVTTPHGALGRTNKVRSKPLPAGVIYSSMKTFASYVIYLKAMGKDSLAYELFDYLKKNKISMNTAVPLKFVGKNQLIVSGKRKITLNKDGVFLKGKKISYDSGKTIQQNHKLIMDLIQPKKRSVASAAEEEGTDDILRRGMGDALYKAAGVTGMIVFTSFAILALISVATAGGIAASGVSLAALGFALTAAAVSALVATIGIVSAQNTEQLRREFARFSKGKTDLSCTTKGQMTWGFDDHKFVIHGLPEAPRFTEGNLDDLTNNPKVYKKLVTNIYNNCREKKAETKGMLASFKAKIGSVFRRDKGEESMEVDQ